MLRNVACPQPIHAVLENGILPLVALLYLDRDNTLLPRPVYLDPVNRCPSLRHLLAPVNIIVPVKAGKTGPHDHP